MRETGNAALARDGGRKAFAVGHPEAPKRGVPLSFSVIPEPTRAGHSLEFLPQSTPATHMTGPEYGCEGAECNSEVWSHVCLVFLVFPESARRSAADSG